MSGLWEAEVVLKYLQTPEGSELPLRYSAHQDSNWSSIEELMHDWMYGLYAVCSSRSEFDPGGVLVLYRSVILYVFCSPYREVLLSPGLAKLLHLDRCVYFLLCNRPVVSADPGSYAHFHTFKHFTITHSLSLSLSRFIFECFAWSSLADEPILSSRCVNIFISDRSWAVKTAVLLTLLRPLIFMDIFVSQSSLFVLRF